MKKIIMLLVSFTILCNLSAQEDAVKGFWYNTEKSSKIKVFKATNGMYYGKIVWLKNADKLDVNNPNPEKAKEPLMGMLFANAFTFDSTENQWTGGTIYDPDGGKTYDCYMWFEDNNTDILYLKGYVMGMKFAGRSVTWTRTEM